MTALKFPVDAWTRVAFPPAIENLSAPTLVEIGQGVEDDYYLDVYTDEYIGSTVWIYDIGCELVSGGLSLPSQTETRDVTPWKGDMVKEIPTRFGMSGASLTAFRFRPPDVEVLWHGARFKAERALVVRRGVPAEQAWASGDVVEAYRVVVGDKFHDDSGMTTFTVPLFPQEREYDAVVA